MEIGLIKVVQSSSYMISFSLYYLLFKNFSFRTNTFIAQIMKLISILVDLFQVKRFNLAFGFSDIVTLCASKAILDSFYLALWHLPHLIVVQKLAPEGVEATIIAICATVNNFFLIEGPALMGAFINRNFIGVSI